MPAPTHQLCQLSISLAFITAISATPAYAGADELCTDRPGLVTAPCTVGSGDIQLELGIFEYELDKDSGGQTIATSYGDALIRAGLNDHTEVRLGWTAWRREVVRSLADDRTVSQGVGDLDLALSYRMTQQDGDFQLGLVPSVTFPVGGGAGTAGDWATGLRVPMALDVGKSWQLAATPELDAAVNESGNGRHLAFGSAFGIEYAVTRSLTLGVGALVMRHDDPAAAYTDERVGATAALQLGHDSQIDVDAQVGVDAETPRHTISVGVTHRF